MSCRWVVQALCLGAAVGVGASATGRSGSEANAEEWTATVLCELVAKWGSRVETFQFVGAPAAVTLLEGAADRPLLIRIGDVDNSGSLRSGAVVFVSPAAGTASRVMLRLATATREKALRAAERYLGCLGTRISGEVQRTSGWGQLRRGGEEGAETFMLDQVHKGDTVRAELVEVAIGKEAYGWQLTFEYSRLDVQEPEADRVRRPEE